jgi:hypothetical protein
LQNFPSKVRKKDENRKSLIECLKSPFNSLAKKFPGKLNTDYVDMFSQSFGMEMDAKSDAKNSNILSKIVRRIAIKIVSMDQKILDFMLYMNVTPGCDEVRPYVLESGRVDTNVTERLWVCRGSTRSS